MPDSVGGMHTILLHGVLSGFRSRAMLQLEIIALRHQLDVLRRNQRTQKRLSRLDRTFWVLLYRIWPRCLDAVVIVKPETVIRWHRKGFRLFWTWRSRPRGRGRPPVPADIKNLIRRMSRENPLWGGRGFMVSCSSLGSRSARLLFPSIWLAIPNCRRRSGGHSSGTMWAVSRLLISSSCRLSRFGSCSCSSCCTTSVVTSCISA